MKTLIISGASGYMGRSFIDRRHNEYNIIALSRNHLENKEYPNVKYISNADFLNSDMGDSISDDTIFLNLAYPRIQDINVLTESFELTYNLYLKAVSLGINKIINISTQSLYDIKRTEAAKETDLLKPFSVYGLGKLHIEEYTRKFSEKNKIKFINLRVASIIGPGFGQRFINKWLVSYLNNQDINIIEKGIKFSFLDINNLINGLALIVDSKADIWNEVYNIGTEEIYTATEIINKIKKLDYESDSKINIERSKFTENTTNAVNIDKLKKSVNYTTRYSLEDSIRAIFKDLRGINV